MSFKTVQAGIAKKEGVSEDRAGAILAAGTRKSSQAAVNANPSLSKVSGTKKPTNLGGLKDYGSNDQKSNHGLIRMNHKGDR